MGRTPGVAAPDPGLLRRDRAPLFDLEVSVVTPLFGGGATPATADPLYPVRPASVRGHLHFWWRACKSSKYATAHSLFAREEDIWGSTEKPGRLGVVVDILRRGYDEHWACYDERDDGSGRYKSVPTTLGGYPAYALFPFKGELTRDQKAVKQPPALARRDVQFRVRIEVTCPIDDATEAMLKAEAEASLWAWLTFGGIGARTRRGCGSLYCSDAPFVPPPSIASIDDWLRQGFGRYVEPATRQLPMPTLRGARLTWRNRAQSPFESWSTAVRVLADYRQGEGVGRNPADPQKHPRRPGRSRWPEADSVRLLSGKAASNHSPTHEAGVYFPRADLGLPIVFHYQNPSQPRGTPQDPPDSVLQSSVDGITRMASPIVLKPLALSATSAVTLMLCLETPHVWDISEPMLHLQVKDEAAKPVAKRPDLYDPAKSGVVKPLMDSNVGGGAITARDGLLHYAHARLHGGEVTF